MTLTEQVMLAHLYGWGPFNADSGCDANVNLLEQTPGYTDPNWHRTTIRPSRRNTTSCSIGSMS